MVDPMSSTLRHAIRQRAESAVNRTDVELLERVCAEDVPALLEQLGEVDDLRAALAQALRERDLAIAHDRQPYPTAAAYESACAALANHHERADKAEAERDELQARMDSAHEAFVNMAQVNGGIHRADALMHVARIMGSLRGAETPSRLTYNRLHEQMRKAEDERDAARAEVKRLRAQQAEANGAYLGVMVAAHTAGRAQQERVKKVEAERDTFRAERNAAFAALRDALGTGPATLGQAVAHSIKAVADRDTARQQVQHIWMAAGELHEFVSPDGDHIDGCPGCRITRTLDAAGPDPRLVALEELADRYTHAFDVLFADAQARANRKEANHG